MAWKSVKFDIPKKNDGDVVTAVQEAFSETGLMINSISHVTAYGEHDFNGTQATLDKFPDYQYVLSLNSMLISTFEFHLGDSLRVRITRTEEIFDKVDLNLDCIPNNANLKNKYKVQQIIPFVKALKSNLGEIDSKRLVTEKLSKDLKKYYDVREADLQRLQNLIEITNEEILKRQTTLEKEFSEKRQSLERQFEERQQKSDEMLEKLKIKFSEDFETDKSSLKAEYKVKFEQLKNDSEALESRKKDYDDRDSKHVRRQIRDQLKHELKNRSEKFELTKGTQKMRLPITVAVATFFSLSAFMVYNYSIAYIKLLAILETKELTSLLTVDLILAGFKPIVFSAACVALAVYFIRWNDKWFQQHADEEFRLKKLELDIDRASWVVEMAMEWKDENQTNISPELLHRLTENLFLTTSDKPIQMHPIEGVVSALFGASSKATIDVPGGTKLELDRKGIRKLKESNTD